MRITKLKDQFLSLISLGGLLNSWESFVQCISARPKLSRLDQLRYDCLQEGPRQMTKGKQKPIDEGIHVINTNSHKKGKKNTKRERNFHGKGSSKQNKDLPKIQCFRCDQYGYYVINYHDQ